jgi:cytochrome c-type biogenesis protein CcmH
MRPSGALLVACVAALALLATGAGVLAARGPDPDAVPTARQVEERTMSPYCPGLTLAACPSDQAIGLRKTISDMVAAGKTNRDIDAWLLATFPQTVIGAPRNPLAWLIPAAGLLGGLGGILIVLRRRPGDPPASGAAPEEPPGPSPADSARLAADLRRFAEGVSE